MYAVFVPLDIFFSSPLHELMILDGMLCIRKMFIIFLQSICMRTIFFLHSIIIETNYFLWWKKEVFWIFGCIKRLFWAETLHPNCLFICDSSFELLKFEKIFFLTKLLCFVFKWNPTNTKWFRANVMVTTHFLFVCKHLFLHNSFRFISFNNRTISCFLIKQIDFCLFSPFQYLH